MELTINWLALGIIAAGIAFIFALILAVDRCNKAQADKANRLKDAGYRAAYDQHSGGP
jgi:hypothetical protein